MAIDIQSLINKNSSTDPLFKTIWDFVFVKGKMIIGTIDPAGRRFQLSGCSTVLYIIGIKDNPEDLEDFLNPELEPVRNKQGFYRQIDNFRENIGLLIRAFCIVAIMTSRGQSGLGL